MKLARNSIARWLLEKLLSSFLISALLVWGPFIGLHIENLGMGTTYTVITSVTLMISLLSYLLVPTEIETLNKIKNSWKRIKGEKEKQEI
jgi:hypothetical protein